MFKFLARLIGPKRAQFEAHREGSRGSAANQALRRTRGEAAEPPRAADMPAVPTKKLQAVSGAPAPAPARQPEAASAEAGFDPYNTGAFDRGASWERVGKRNL
jgi:hypothetical protein